MSISIVMTLALQSGCGRPANKPGTAPTTPPGPVTLPDFGASRVLQAGIKFQETTVNRGGVPMRVWYYEPEKFSGKLPLVIVPPAGSTLFVGMDLSEGDRPEQLPYVQAGFAVASFEIDGHVPNMQAASDAAITKGARQFKDAEAGVANERTALDLVLKKSSNVDPDRVYIAGHSSAATLALQAASQDTRIKGCIAYAPVTDLEDRLGKAIPMLDRAVPGFRDFVRTTSPKTLASQLKCPVLLFHAQDDDNVPVQQTQTFAENLKATNPNVTLVIARSGGHAASMMSEGIPKGIEWLKKQSSAKK